MKKHSLIARLAGGATAAVALMLPLAAPAYAIGDTSPFARTTPIPPTPAVTPAPTPSATAAPEPAAEGTGSQVDPVPVGAADTGGGATADGTGTAAPGLSALVVLGVLGVTAAGGMAVTRRQAPPR